MRYHWHSYNGGYAIRWEKGKTIYMHRQIAEPPKGMMVDHKNHNRADNTRENLRNQGKKSGSITRCKSVERRRDRKKCFARIRINGKRTYLGCFDVKRMRRGPTTVRRSSITASSPKHREQDTPAAHPATLGENVRWLTQRSRAAAL